MNNLESFSTVQVEIPVSFVIPSKRGVYFLEE